MGPIGEVVGLPDEESGTEAWYEDMTPEQAKKFYDILIDMESFEKLQEDYISANEVQWMLNEEEQITKNEEKQILNNN